MGTWLINESSNGVGIRDYKYSRSMTVNPMTYNTIKTAAIPHGVGSVWCTMLYDAYWNMVDKYGFNPNFYEPASGGNNMMLQLVVDGLKLQPCSPGFVDARDAIIKADSIRNGGANRTLLWKAFARRGLGWSAKQGSSSSRSDGTQAYDMPPLTGVASTSAALSKIQLAPNPSNGNTWLILPDQVQQLDIQVYDLSGKLLLEQNAMNDGSSKVKLELGALQSGIYLVKAMNGGETYQTKLFITQ
jgi:hypothetical protein